MNEPKICKRNYYSITFCIVDTVPYIWNSYLGPSRLAPLDSVAVAVAVEDTSLFTSFLC